MSTTTSPPRSKIRTAADAVAEIRPGATLMVGGFGLVGAPLVLIEALGAHPGARDLTIISNNLGEPGRGLGRLLLDGRVRKAVGSYFTSNPDVVRAHQEGRLEVELVPQGTLAESIRAGGAGIGGFYTKTGLGTPLTVGCEEREIRGERYVFQESRHADVALVRARTADELGNLAYAKTAPQLQPRHGHGGGPRDLGIGIPTFVADHLPLDSVALQTENGLLGVGPTPGPGEADPDLVHAGKQPVTARPGASYFASSASFGMIRGGHVDVAVLGALQVDGRGRIANWAVPGKPVLGVGGAMDLLVGARTVVVTTTHTTKDGSPKIVDAATYPLTAQRPVDVVVTEGATFRVSDGGLVLVEIAEGVTLGWVRAHTTAPFAVALPEVSGV